MIDRRTAVLSALAFAATAGRAVAQTSPRDRADLARIETYLTGVRTLRARFVQTGPDGELAHGKAFVQRPGKMRFEYDPPSPFLLVANRGTLIFRDESLKQTTNIPLSRTPLGLLLAVETRLSGDVSVTTLIRPPGQLQVGLVRASSPGEGSLTLILSDEPMVLRGWIVVDQQGKHTKVTLTDPEPGARLDAKLFEYQNVIESTGGGG
jgi:hypothetical protein